MTETSWLAPLFALFPWLFGLAWGITFALLVTFFAFVLVDFFRWVVRRVRS